jgi:hypothetical protein
MDQNEHLPLAARPLRLRLVDGLAQFAKALSIYPASNSRVVTNLEAFLQTFGQVQAEGKPRPVRILFGGQHLRVDGEEHDVAHSPQVGWLRDRCEQTGLAGIELAPGLQRNSVVAFCRLLLENFAAHRDETDFDAVWGSAPADLLPIERRFDGDFTGLVSDLDLDGTSGSPNHLASALAGEQSIQEQLLALQMVLDPDQAGPKLSMDLLDHVTRLLPADVMTDLPRVVSMTNRVLDVLIHRLELQQQPQAPEAERGPEGSAGPRPQRPHGDQREIERMLTLVARGLFSRSDAELPRRLERTPAEMRARSGHREDADIADDLESLAREFRALPDFAPEMALFRAEETHAEQIGVFLHYLLQDDGELRHDLLRGHILALLSSGAASVREVLDEYVDLLRSPQGRQSIHTGRLLEVLRTARLGGVLRTRAIVTAESVLESFPDDFGLYLDALDLAREDDLAELAEVCRTLGDDLITGNGPRLVREQELLKHGRAEAVLHSAHPELAALALVVLQHGGERYRQLVVDYLRALELADPEACLLTVADGLEYFPREYLAALMDRSGAADRRKTEKLHHWVSMMLCRYVRNAENDEARRTYAIRLLADFWQDEAAELLRGLARSPLIGTSGVPAGIRKAAKDTLAAMGAN